MANKKIVIKESELKKAVKESIRTVLGGMEPLTARLDEMARVGFIGGKLEVYVWTDDPGNIPHVHIRDANSQGHEFETCVRLDKADYFLHGHYTDKLNSSQKKALMSFMQDSPKSPRYNTNYDLAVDMWNLNNSNVTITPQQNNGTTLIPDYTGLP